MIVGKQNEFPIEAIVCMPRRVFWEGHGFSRAANVP